jgi:hypothetical protein
MPPTDFCKLRLLRRAGTNPSSRSSQGRWPRPPSFSYASSALSLAEAVTRGEPHCVHPRRPRCRFLLVAQVCPTSMPAWMRHHRTVLPPMCSDDQRVRVRGPSEGCVCRGASGVFAIALASGACALKPMPTKFPSSASSGHPLSPVRAPTREETPADDVDRPRLAFHRHPAKGTGIPRTGMP